MSSKQSRLVANSLKRMNFKRIIAAKIANQNFDKLACEVPGKRFIKKHLINTYKIDGFTCIHIPSQEKSNQHIIYFHGGYYTMPAVSTHWHIIDGILSRTNANVTFANYPLSPEYQCTDTISMVEKAFKNIAENYNNIILMGDSAGGGLALALAQHLRDTSYEVQPKKIILVSPWLDVSMDNDISQQLIDSDIILDLDTLISTGKAYAGDLSTKSYLCSPLYGDCNNLCDIAIFTGTNDILFTQCALLKEKMDKADIPLSFYTYEDMLHVFIGYPIPEAKDALDEIAEFINR